MLLIGGTGIGIGIERNWMIGLRDGWLCRLIQSQDLTKVNIVCENVEVVVSSEACRRW
jgi:hypothetical protein